jgi:hypothetical protein
MSQEVFVGELGDFMNFHTPWPKANFYGVFMGPKWLFSLKRKGGTLNFSKSVY